MNENTDTLMERAAEGIAPKGKAPARKAPEKKGTTPGPVPENPSPIIRESHQPLTAEEAGLAARISAESVKEWETIGEDSAVDFSLGRWMFELPEPAKRKVEAGELAFRWVTRTAARIDEIRNKPIPYRWWICNRTTAPFLEDFIDPVLGGIIREDQILVMQPFWMSQKRQQVKDAMTADQVSDLTRLHGKGKEGVEFVAGKRTANAGTAMRQEVTGGDVGMYDGDAAEGPSGDASGLDGFLDTE